MGRRKELIVALLFATLLVACSSGGGGDDQGRTTLGTSLSGGEVAPGPGDEDGSGSAHISFGEQPGTICYSYEASFIDPVTAVKLGNGNPGDFGATLITLASGPQGSPGGCVTGVDQAILRGIKLAPGSYYIEIDTAPFPEGALRGQFAPSA